MLKAVINAVMYMCLLGDEPKQSPSHNVSSQAFPTTSPAKSVFGSPLGATALRTGHCIQKAGMLSLYCGTQKGSLAGAAIDRVLVLV